MTSYPYPTKYAVAVLVFFALFLASLPLAIARAEENASADASARVKMRIEQNGIPLLPALGPQIKQRIEEARESLKFTSTTTRARVNTSVKARVESVHELIGERKEDLRRILAERKEATRERGETAKESARERWGESVQNHVRVIVGRLTAAVERLGVLADRMESRIEKMQEDGKNMANSVVLLASARTEISLAQDKAIAVSASLETALASENPKEHMQNVRAAVKNAEEQLRVAHKALKDVLDSMRIEAGVGASASIN